MNNFYDKNDEYSIPVTSNYMKFEDGDNRFRILGAFSEGTAIQGQEYWKTQTVEGKEKRTPIRVAKNANIPITELEVNKFGNLDMPKYFWAFPVWNYTDKKVQILEITQKSILSYIKKVIENPKWGDPRDYDFIVTRSKEGEKTVYTVTNDPKEKIDENILDQYLAIQINLNALFEGKDPFQTINESESTVNDDAVAAGL